MKVQIEANQEIFKNVNFFGLAAWRSNDDGDYFVLLRPSYDLGVVSVGPEFSAGGSKEYSNQRFGVHVGGFELGPVSMGASVGAEHEEAGRYTPYGSLGLSMGF